MNNVAVVIGAGTMGMGIAYSFALAGFSVKCIERSSQQIDHAQNQLNNLAQEGVKRNKLSQRSAGATLARITFNSELCEIPSHARIIIESVPERAHIKQEVLTAAEARSPETLATNTSALSIDLLAEPLKRPERFIGMHFFNPVHKIDVVELVKGEKTSPRTLQEVQNIVEELHKDVAVVSNSPGFASSRLDLLSSIEAIRMVEEGVSIPSDIDRIARLAYKHPVGPLRLSDIVGLDVRLDVSRSLARTLGPRFDPPQLLIDMVSRGDIGVKSGRGFFEW